MSRFLVLLNASDPAFGTAVENANGTIVSVFAPGMVIVDGDDTALDTTLTAVAQLATVTATSPLGPPLDASSLRLDDDAAEAVAAWNQLFEPEPIAAKQSPFRGGEEWDTPGGCVIEEDVS